MKKLHLLVCVSLSLSLSLSLGAQTLSNYSLFQDANLDWSIGGSSENLQIREPEDGNKLWAEFKDDWGFEVYGNLKFATPGGSWLSGKTGTGGLSSRTQQTSNAYHPFLRQKTSSGHVVNLGGLGDYFGFYGYDKNRTQNGYDYSLTMSMNSGSIGIGVSQNNNTLQVHNYGKHNISCSITGAYPTTTGTSTNYYKQLDVAPANYNMSSGVVDNGYRIGLAVHGYVHNGTFQGTLQDQIGAWIRTGAYSTIPTGTINRSIALKIDNLTSPTTTINESYGIYQGSSNAFNYFAGTIGIGTTTAGTHKLAVEGSIAAREVVVLASGWADFVFEEDYQLPTLSDVENHIKANGHLKDIPSEKEVLEQGIGLGDMDAKLLQKIEELTLYVIEQQKEIEELKKIVNLN